MLAPSERLARENEGLIRNLPITDNEETGDAFR
jgi:hypothetical protein